MPGGNQPVLVDRQNIVLWADMPAASAAGIAAKVRGTSLDPEEPQEGKPTQLTRGEAQTQPGLVGPSSGAMPPQLAAHAAAARAVSDDGSPDGPPPKESAATISPRTGDGSPPSGPRTMSGAAGRLSQSYPPRLDNSRDAET